MRPTRFQVISKSVDCLARTGTLSLKSGRCFNTPTFLAPTSRGVIPHLSPDNVVRNQGDIPGAFLGAEDFLEAIPHREVPFLKSPVPIRDLLTFPEHMPLVLSTRRSLPVPSPQPNGDDHISIMTAEGNRKMPAQLYYEFVTKFNPDVILSPADIPNLSPGGRPGSNRRKAMMLRSEKWLRELLAAEEKQNVLGSVDVFAPVLPGISFEHQKAYFAKLKSLGDDISGVAFWSSRSGRLSEKQAALDLKRQPAKILQQDETLETELDMFTVEFAEYARLYSNGVATPHEILDFIAKGIDVVVADCVSGFTDAGVALDFVFPVNSNNGDHLPLGYNLWDPDFAQDMTGFGRLVESPAGSTYYRAYVNHLLNAREMTAWVLLQSHNMTVMNRFFEGIRTSIKLGRFAQDRAKFVEVFGEISAAVELRDRYKSKDTVPKVRGYSIAYNETLQRKQEGETERMNDPRFKRL